MSLRYKAPFLHERVWPTVNLSPHTHRLATVGVASLLTPAHSGLGPDLREASILIKNLRPCLIN